MTDNESKVVKTGYDTLTYQVIGCAMAVHRQLGPGLREDSYQRALAEKQIPYQTQVMLAVSDQEHQDALLGYYIPDFIVAEKVIVEIKALGALENAHIAQVIGYLAVSGLQVGLLLNFGTRSLQQRRIFPPRSVRAHQVNRQWLFIPDWLKGDDPNEP